MPYNATHLTRNNYILMYDLECCTKTGIPFLITFCLYNCMLGLFVDNDTITKKYDAGIPVFYQYKPDMKNIYSVFRRLLETVASVGRVFLMAYNGNAFDNLYMVNGFRYDYCVIKGNNILCMDFKAFGVKYTLRDLRDYITTGNLASIGDLIHLPKLETGFDSLDYAIRDTAIIGRAWCDVVLRNYVYLIGTVISHQSELICYRSTASLSYHYVCNMCKLEKFTVCPDVNDYLCKAYYGAKCDFSKLGLTTDISMYDIRSMYPAAMTQLMPYGEMSYYESLSYIPDRLYIATCTLVKPVNKTVCLDSTFGVVPCIYDNNTLYACAGTVTAVMTSVELENARMDGWKVTDLRDIIMWQYKDTVFNIYRQLYALKQKHAKDSPLYWFSKIVMNSSIGKFVSKPKYIPHYINYFCMSYSRRMLVGLKNMMKVCNVPYVIYGDTDSIVLRNVDMNELVHMYPSLLDHHLAIDMLLPTGEIECTGDIIVLGKKLYYINDNKFSCKGHNRKEISK